MKVLVIGGTNFIGPHVVRYLTSSGHQVMVFHRGQTLAKFDRNVQFLLGDRQIYVTFNCQSNSFHQMLSSI